MEQNYLMVKIVQMEVIIYVLKIVNIIGFIQVIGDYNMQCTMNSSCYPKNSAIMYLNVSNNQCVQNCESKYVFNYYQDDDDSKDLTNLYACVIQIDTCVGSLAFDGTEMKYLTNNYSIVCIDTCQYNYWYQSLTNQVLTCVKEENTNYSNLQLENNIYYTSINVEDKQCIIKQQCVQSGYQYVIKDNLCYYYKQITNCQQFSQIQEFSTYVIQSDQNYRCVEQCNDNQYYYLNEQENNEKTCIASCQQLNGNYQVDDETRQCVKIEENKKENSNLGLIIGISVTAAVVIIILIIVIIIVVKKSQQKKKDTMIFEESNQQMIKNTQNTYI